MKPVRPTRAGGVLPDIHLDEDAPTPMYQQLYFELRQRIVNGDLDPGVRLASTRAFAEGLGVSRFTLATAFEQLRSEGYVEARRGGGTFVTRSLPDLALRASREVPREESSNSRGTPGPPPSLSARGKSVAGIVITGPRDNVDEPVAFRPRRPPLDAFPFALWARLVRKQWSTYQHHLLDYGDPAGYRPLREAIAAHLAASRGVRCSADQVIITSGSQQAFDIAFRSLLDPGDAAWVEEPGYLDVRAALVANGAHLIPVRVDTEGIDVDEGIRRAPHARLAYVSPSHQYPTGRSLSPARREHLLVWAEAANAWIVEDDYDSYFRYSGKPLPALQSLDAKRSGGRATRVIYVGTFSKTMFPSLRLGYCVVPEALAAPFSNARAVADRNSPLADQAALAAFISEGFYDRHLRRVREICAERYDALRREVDRKLGDVLTLGESSAGTHVIGYLADGFGENVPKRVAAAAMAQGMVVFPVSRYCLEAPVRDGLVLGYGGLAPRRIAAGVERLAEVIDGVERASSSGRKT